uniref:Odorant receptor n=1 Tax=Yemma signatus TaxID=300820 RepID=A0A385H602_9HEMI|nr:odorant receptor [Yemma signatus]
MEGMRLAGILSGPAWYQKLHSLLVYFIWIISVTHFLLKVVLEHDQISIQVMMESLHWAVMSLLGMIGFTSFYFKLDTYGTLHKIVKSGIFRYKSPFNDEQKRVLNEEKIRIKFMVKMFFILHSVAFAVTQLKGVMFDLHKWGTQFPGWFPFTINSFETYAAGSLFQLIFGFNLVMCSQAMASSLTALNGHLCSQIRILSISLRIIFKDTSQPEIIKDKMKECVKHHYVIIEFFNKVQYFFGTLLLFLAVCMMIMMCLAGYVVTDPESTLTVVLPLLSVFVPEVTIVSYLCYAGQRIMDESEHLYETIIQTKWYLQPPEIRRDLMLIMMKSQKTFIITGGSIQKFNLEGLSEILQSSYTYFNMLKAVRQ